MTDNTMSTKVITLDDGTKVLTRFRTMTTPQGVKQVQTSQALTADMLNATIASLQADLALLN